jgi:hypothetical protein
MLALIFALVTTAFGGQVATRPSHHKGQFLVKAVTFKHRLRACNAYPYAAPLDVYKNRVEKLTADAPLPYKTCREFTFPLKAGDKLKFKVGDANAGVFSVSDLPNTDAVLLLVIHRHDTLTNAVSFESHVFASLLNAQLAIIDTYKGSEKASIRIQDRGGDKKNSRGEDLHYNSVVAVNPGDYDVMLQGVDGKVKSKATLVAVNKESYVVLRVGVEAQQGQSYPQEVIVAPKSEEPKWSGAYSPAPLALLASLLFLCFQ